MELWCAEKYNEHLLYGCHSKRLRENYYYRTKFEWRRTTEMITILFTEKMEGMHLPN